MRTLNPAVWTLCALLAVAPGAGGQQPSESPQPPVFGTGVDVVAVDVNVVDGQGRPVPSLQPSDFTVSVDGQVRRLVSAEFLALGREPEEAEPARQSHYSSNAGLAAGRLLVLAIDQGFIPSGEGRLVMDAAKLLLERLTPADRVALLAFPQPTVSVDFTADLGKVRDALGRIVGRSAAFAPSLEQPSSTAAPRTLSDSLTSTISRAHAQASTDVLRGLLRSLRQVEAAKSVVLISGPGWSESPDVLRELADLAAEARVSLYALQIEAPGVDASRGGPTDVPVVAGNAQGLQALASLTRGELFRTSGSGRGPFERIARELQGYYLLGFAPEPGDRDGRSHEIRVGVSRSGMTVRSRGRIRIAAAPGLDERQSAQSLQSLLGAPYLSSSLPLRVATFARPAGTGSESARVLISAEVGRPGGNLQGVSVGYRLIDSKGRVVKSEWRTPPSQGVSPLAFRAEVALAPGLYTLRLAALDDRERHGSVEHPVKAAAITANALSLSDLMLQPGELLNDGPQPVVDLESAGPFLAAVEAQSDRPEAWRDVSAIFEIARGENGAPLQTLSARSSDLAPSRRLFSAQLSAEGLEAGDYWARAVLSIAGRPVAQAARPFRRP